MKKDIANLATDLRRVAYWIYAGQTKLACDVLKKSREKYVDLTGQIGCYDDIWQEVEKIENLEGGKDRASERALTVSVILLNSVL